MPEIGQSLSHYSIVEKIGKGGMGEVFRAKDQSLGRDVAIKVLPGEFAKDADRMARFQREAKLLASLNHPNIIHIYDIASDGGVDFIAMEYVEGKTLEERIARRGLPLGETLKYAVQIADALAKAHSAGIVHRDLKPSNIMVNEDGTVKILDFGLAKLIEQIKGDEFASTATLEGEVKPVTEEGIIVGTVAYMSPEQAEGKKVDSRSDIFSFGSVLYEMLTGQKAFHRETRVATLASIINEEPKPATQFIETLPPEIEQVLARCLRKDPQRRWQNMSDLKVVLQDLKEDSESGKLRRPQESADRRRKSPFAWVGLGSALIAAAILLWVLRPKEQDPLEYQITRLTFDSGLSWSPAISPDGKMFAYASNRSGKGDLDIWIQQIAGGPPLQLTSNPADDVYPSFSPDGAWVVFTSGRDGGGIFEVAALGGGERRIADWGALPRYSPDGSWISIVRAPASLEGSLTKIFLIPSKGGAPVPFQPEFSVEGVNLSSAPVWSPDGKYLIFNGRRIGNADSLDWWVAPVSGGPAVRTGAHQSLPFLPVWQCPYTWEGSFVYYSTGSTVEGVNIFRARIDKGSWKIRGPAEPITSGPGMQYQASVLPDGRILYHNLNWLAKVGTLQARPDMGLITGDLIPISQDVTAKFNPSISLDGSKLIYSAFGGFQKPRFEVRLQDLVSGEEKVFPMSATRLGQFPRISPDGSVVSYRDDRGGMFKTLIMSAKDSTGREVCDSCLISGFYADSRFALVWEEGRRMLRLDTISGAKTPVLEAPAGQIFQPALSPDDRWIAFVLNKPDGRVAMYIAPLTAGPPTEKDWVLLFEEDRYLGSPAWSPNGQMLYYLSERDGFCCVWSQKLDPSSKKPVGQSQAVFHAHESRIRLNFPKGNGTVAVAKDKLALWMGESTGNIYMATPKSKK